VAEAADILFGLTSFATFDQLFGGRRLTPATVARRLTATADRSIITAGASAESSGRP
jgi:hypothetical protein